MQNLTSDVCNLSAFQALNYIHFMDELLIE